MEDRQIQFPVGRGQGRELELSGLAIRGVVIYNNTPAYLYLSLHPDPVREDCMVQVEPYTYMSLPLEAQERLYLADGELVAPLDSNAKAVVIWGQTPRALDIGRVKRTVEYALASGPVKADGSGSANSSSFRALGASTGGSVDGPQPRQYVLPGFAAHRTLYAALSGGASFTSARLEGLYGKAWHTILDVTPSPASSTLTAVLTDLAFPEQVRLVVTPNQDATLSAVVRLDV